MARGEDPASVTIPYEATEQRTRYEHRKQMTWDSPKGISASLVALRKRGWKGKIPAGHLKSVFELPGREGEVQEFPKGMFPTVRDMMQTYAPGGLLGFEGNRCADAVAKYCSARLEDCGAACMGECVQNNLNLNMLTLECLRRSAGKPFVLRAAAESFRAFGARRNDSWLVEQYAGQMRPGRKKFRKSKRSRRGMLQYEMGKKVRQRRLPRKPISMHRAIPLRSLRQLRAPLRSTTKSNILAHGSRQETREKQDKTILLEDFIQQYNSSDMYSVGEMPAALMNDLNFMPFLTCGGYTLGSRIWGQKMESEGSRLAESERGV